MPPPCPRPCPRHSPRPTVFEETPGAASAPLGPCYRRREPEKTLLYQVVAGEFAAFDSALREESDYGRGLPAFVEKEILAYLDCGILANGFARVACRDCRREIVVAFSCKGRGLCPSCTSRRMHDLAARLVDSVIPFVPVRQWVLTFSPRVRWHLAQDPRLASEALTLFVRSLFNFQRRRARALGIRLPRANGSGAITFVQRFGSAIQLALHLHTLLPDAVFVPVSATDLEARPRIVFIDPPSDGEVQSLLRTIIKRVLRLLQRRGRLDPDAPPDLDDPLVALRAAASRPLSNGPPVARDDLPPLCARIDGFSLHAARAVHEHDRAGLENLARYCARPALSLDRLSRLDDGSLLYRMKRTFSDGTSAIAMTTREFMARLCAVIPPPRRHLTRYHGIFAARARRRAALTGRKSKPRTPPPPAPPAVIVPALPAQPTPPVAGFPVPPPGCPPPSPLSAPGRHPVSPIVSGLTPLFPLPVVLGAPPPDPDRPPRLPWADLLRRVHGIDINVCAHCGGRLRVIAYIDQPDVVKKILDHLGLPSTFPPRGPPRPRPPPPPDEDPAGDSSDHGPALD